LIFILVSLIPLAIYFLILAVLNRRPHPVMVAGTWDFAGVLLGVSGLLVLLGPGILSSFSQPWRDFWIHARNPATTRPDEGSDLWLLLAGLYFILIVAGSAYLVLRQRNATAIYNIAPAVLEEVLAEVLNGLGFSWARSGSRIFLSPQISPSAKGMASAEATDILTLEPFAALAHVTLRWESDEGSVREEVEAELNRALARIYTRYNPASTWFIGVAASLICLTFLNLVALLIQLILRR